VKLNQVTRATSKIDLNRSFMRSGFQEANGGRFHIREHFVIYHGIYSLSFGARPDNLAIQHLAAYLETDEWEAFPPRRETGVLD
jgi:hypothetical protein